MKTGETATCIQCGGTTELHYVPEAIEWICDECNERNAAECFAEIDAEFDRLHASARQVEPLPAGDGPPF